MNLSYKSLGISQCLYDIVIMCSAMGQQNMVIDAIQSGAMDFIVKPFQPDRVLEAVKKVIG